MSLHRKLVTLVGLIILVILSSTLAIVYVASQSIMVQQAKQNAVSIISTIDSALDSGIPDFQFEAILLHLKRQEPQITSFDIYKLTGYLYDIASTNPRNIGTQASSDGALAVQKNTVITSMKGNVLQIVAPIHVNGKPVYVASVGFSISHDLAVTRQLLFKVLTVGLIALCCAVIATWLFARQLLSRPLLTIVEAANDIAVGNLTVDLSKQSPRKDEIGVLARSFDKMAENLRELISGISQASDQLNQAFKELVASADHASRGALHVSDVMNHIAHKTALQAQHSTTATHSMEDVAAAVGSVAATSAEASESAYGVAERVREGMVALRRTAAEIESLKERASETGIDREERVDAYQKAWHLLNDAEPMTQRVAGDMQGISEMIRQVADESYRVLAEMERVEEVARDSGIDLRNIAATVEGQLGSIQEVNRSATQLSQMAMELRELVFTLRPDEEA